MKTHPTKLIELPLALADVPESFPGIAAGHPHWRTDTCIAIGHLTDKSLDDLIPVARELDTLSFIRWADPNSARRIGALEYLNSQTGKAIEALHDVSRFLHGDAFREWAVGLLIRPTGSPPGLGTSVLIDPDDAGIHVRPDLPKAVDR